MMIVDSRTWPRGRKRECKPCLNAQYLAHLTWASRPPWRAAYTGKRPRAPPARLLRGLSLDGTTLLRGGRRSLCQP